MATRRQLRVAELLQQELGEMIAFELKDPRLEFVSVTRVSVTQDLRYARVYVSQLGDDIDKAEVISALEHAGGYLRYNLGQRIKLALRQGDDAVGERLCRNAGVDQFRGKLNLFRRGVAFLREDGTGEKDQACQQKANQCHEACAHGAFTYAQFLIFHASPRP